jgi:hypothetical protein
VMTVAAAAEAGPNGVIIEAFNSGDEHMNRFLVAAMLVFAMTAAATLDVVSGAQLAAADPCSGGSGCVQQ